MLVSEAKAEVDREYGPCKINTLCQRHDSHVDVVCFDKAAPLLLFAKKFYVMTKELNSDLFHAIWSLAMEEDIAKLPKMSVCDIEANVLRPTFDKCQKLIAELRDLSMTLANVDRLFGPYTIPQLEHELKLLLHGVNKCLCQSLSDNWIHHVVLRIEDYRKVCRYQDAANSFLKLRDSLKLTKGDFRDVDRISNQVTI